MDNILLMISAISALMLIVLNLMCYAWSGYVIAKICGYLGCLGLIPCMRLFIVFRIAYHSIYLPVLYLTSLSMVTLGVIGVLGAGQEALIAVGLIGWMCLHIALVYRLSCMCGAGITAAVIAVFLPSIGYCLLAQKFLVLMDQDQE